MAETENSVADTPAIIITATDENKTDEQKLSEEVQKQQEPNAENADSSASSQQQSMAFDWENHEFIIPSKKISLPEHVDVWQKSEAYKDLLGFIGAINGAVQNKKITDSFPVSEEIKKLVNVIEKLDKLIDENPPVDQPQRFGNKAFRDFFARFKENAESLLKEALDEKLHRAVPEIAVYLVESVGNDTRIDYGTGHELAFAAFLCCLFKIGALCEADAPATALKLFQRYLELVRKLQQTYKMEPAGSQGVWSLDDHQFIPFIWGSSQLLDHRRILPKSFVNPDIHETFDKDYMFLGCIKYICKVKTGPFPEHSNQLWNISGVKLWSKVNSGLIKMYKAEILAKFPVVQHFLFGSLLSFNAVT